MIGSGINNKGNTKAVMILFITVLTASNLALKAQGEKKYIRQGNKEYFDNKFSESEISYRRAIDRNESSSDALFNIGDALYKQNKFDDAGTQFLENSGLSDDNIRKAAALYNLGNSLLMADKIQESIDAYKGSLKLNPDNMEAKYNLAYAQDLLQQQQQQQQQQQNKQDQSKDNKGQDENQNQEQNQEQEQNQNEDQNQNSEEEQQGNQQQQEDQQSISKEDAERLLDAIANDEKDVQEKVKLAKAAKARVRTAKNW
jgi:Ca-activated chloride channel family protein